jgi:hypothetical protein
LPSLLSIPLQRGHGKTGVTVNILYNHIKGGTYCETVFVQQMLGILRGGVTISYDVYYSTHMVQTAHSIGVSELGSVAIGKFYC